MDANAFERLVREHQRMVYCVALSHCKDPSSAEDVAQEAFPKAYRPVDEMRDPARLKTWLYSIARFTAMGSRRGVSLRPPWGAEGPLPDSGFRIPVSGSACLEGGIVT